MRLFLGIPLPEGTKKEISQLVNQLKILNLPVKWESEEKWHVTLKFLGETDKNQELRIMNYVKEGTKEVPPFFLKPEKVGYFYKGHLIIWVALTGQLDSLKKLHQQLEENLEKIGFPKEEREFKGHITIGRGKKLSGQQLRELQEAIYKLKLPRFSEFKVKQINLYQSILKSEGSSYSIIGEFKFS